MSTRKYDPDNRFDRAYMEHRQQSYGPPRRGTLDDRFESLRGDYVEPQSTRQWIRDDSCNDRFECLRTDYSEKVHYMPSSPESKPVTEKVYYMPSTNTSSPPKNTEIKPTFLTRPPGLPSPLLRKKTLTLENDEQFPSLPSSPNLPKTPKTPKTPIEPLREEIEFIPLPKAQTSLLEESEQFYKVVRKISGGSWSDRVKFFGPAEGIPKEDTLNYDEDGFPMIKDVEDMVNSFS